MSKLKVMETVPLTELDRLQNKLVEDVMEYHENSIYGSYKLWTGSTEEQYFSIYLMRGVMTIALCPCELFLIDNIITYAMYESLTDIISKHKNNQEKLRFAAENYYLEKCETEITLTTFDGVMECLKWKFKGNVKVKKGMLFYQ